MVSAMKNVPNIGLCSNNSIRTEFIPHTIPQNLEGLFFISLFLFYFIEDRERVRRISVKKQLVRYV